MGSTVEMKEPATPVSWEESQKAEDGWPGEESSSEGRNVLPSDFTQL